ncbi:MAG: hypothetical protein LUO88_02790 [Methanoregulaceae archaeon]|nr:hypothetical protein [Methanoregulaceae archaeon]
MNRNKILVAIACLLLSGACPAVSGWVTGDTPSGLVSDLLGHNTGQAVATGNGFSQVIALQQAQAINIIGVVNPSAAKDHIDPRVIAVRQHDQMNRAENTATWKARLYYGNRQDVLISLYQQKHPVGTGKITQQDVPDTMLSLLAALDVLTGVWFP